MRLELSLDGTVYAELPPLHSGRVFDHCRYHMHPDPEKYKRFVITRVTNVEIDGMRFVFLPQRSSLQVI